MNRINTLTPLAGRILLSLIFISSGLSKLGSGYAGTEAYMNMMGVPAALLPLVIATEIFAGLAILAGFQTRVAALLLAGFTLLAAILFHSNFADQMQSILFMKNLAIAGGLLLLVANGSGAYAIDNFKARH
ncbi:DoxX family protein [Methylophaga sp. OBS4]|uniref:DoxX family protein n=1 Tax=Methylophaga sp. OBS4 TaxID=2991935 RepID=UPI00224FAAF0|nr:DoxX family protein [Methylophaga sp. OBS4]MCX4188256.1 DoxX family protein [Methylophaga sp. OBS4]